MSPPLNQLLTGDCLPEMRKLPAGCVNLAFADPPFNIGFDYGEDGIDDNMTPQAYEGWSHAWLREVHRVLADDGTFWLAIGDEWAAELKVLCNRIGFHLRSWVVWYYTFGVHSSGKLTRSHAHLFYFTKSRKKFVFKPMEIRVPSARSMVYNDTRANPDGRLPDDTWILRPQDLPAGFPADGDMWFIPRICGTFKQRQDGAANQMPEQLLGRIIRACSNEGDVVLDPMAGTGTTLATAKKLGRQYLGYEMVDRFAKLATTRINATKVGDVLDGPIPQGG